MSHFSLVLVLPDALLFEPSKVTERVEQEMAPFMENCCAEPEKRFMEFFDEEDEMLEKYEKGSQQYIVMPDGRLLLPWDQEFGRKPGEDILAKPKGPPDDLERREVPFNETFSTFEEFATEWYGRPHRDETYNRYGYWQNPNAKWDWFEIGGRWAGYFQLKEDGIGAVGSQYNFTGVFTPSVGGVADICFKNAIDFERMRNEAGENAGELYDKVQEAIKDTPRAESWEEIKADFDLDKPGEVEKARARYHDQSRVKAFSKLGYDVVGWMTAVDEFQIPREQYVQNARNHAGVPHAILKDGKWYESGRMGMFGMAFDEKDPQTWTAMANKIFDSLTAETLLVAIDCHI